jgi:uncharacterized protein (DUF3084 family)
MIRQNNSKLIEQKKEEEFTYRRMSVNLPSETSSTFFNPENSGQSGRYEELMHKKEQLLKSLSSEIEYNSKINFMIGQEKENLLAINENMIEINEKTKVIKAAQKDLSENEKENSKKNKNGKSIYGNLTNELSRMKYLINNQDSRIATVNNEINNKKYIIDKKKEEVRDRSKKLERQIKSNKENIKKEIQNVKQMKEVKNSKENDFIRIVLGLDIIKKYNYYNIVKSSAIKMI